MVEGGEDKLAAVCDHLTLTGPYREFLSEQDTDAESQPQEVST